MTVRPSWWGGPHHCGTLVDRIAEIVKGMLPAGIEFGYDFRTTPYFEAVEVVLDEPAVERLRAKIRGALEELDPEVLAWTPRGDEHTSLE